MNALRLFRIEDVIMRRSSGNRSRNFRRLCVCRLSNIAPHTGYSFAFSYENRNIYTGYNRETTLQEIAQKLT